MNDGQLIKHNFMNFPVLIGRTNRNRWLAWNRKIYLVIYWQFLPQIANFLIETSFLYYILLFYVDLCIISINLKTLIFSSQSCPKSIPIDIRNHRITLNYLSCVNSKCCVINMLIIHSRTRLKAYGWYTHNLLNCLSW